jgi:protein phosphatase
MTHETFVLSDVGCVREHNEDDCLILEGDHVYVVADGMGGHNCGEVASYIAIRSVADFYGDPELTERLRSLYAKLREEKGLGDVTSFHQFRLRSAIEYGNLQIYRQASEDPRLEDMGTTIVGLAFVGSRVYVGHVGDSRCYRLRKGKLEQITDDHSLANEYIQMNLLRPEDLPYFPYKNVIVRALGLQEDVEVDTQARTALPGDRYVLCSDGLTDLVNTAEILEILSTSKGAPAAAEAMVQRALEYGGVDNVTVLIVDVQADGTLKPDTVSTQAQPGQAQPGP